MIRAVMLALIALLGQIASAHDLDLTLIKVNRGETGSTIQVITPLSRLVETARLGDHPSGPALDMAVRERLIFGADTPAQLNANSQSDTLTWSAEVKGRPEFSCRFDESTPSAQTIVATYENGALKSEVVLDAEKPIPTTTGLLGTGVQHILAGLDHILFVLGLALLGGGWRAILKVLTAFTVAHSVTLVAAATGLIQGNPRIVEPLIALSIVALAIEGMRQPKKPGDDNLQLRIAIAFGFGLIHGFGFAGGLTELGLKGNQLVRNLLAFSVGIELGQIAILAPTLLALALVARATKVRASQFSLASSVCLGMIGCFWFVERVL
ncbi:MAG: HupE/UreJ family protein [Fimbriimonadaceae bacterium]|nr:HupE/UreJ family protein [Fimbriimonadaceae bacterium]